jgi:hypothetical protein
MNPQQILVVAAATLMVIGGATVAKGVGVGAKAAFYKAPKAVITKVFHTGKHMVTHPIDSVKDGAIKPGKK